MGIPPVHIEVPQGSVLSPLLFVLGFEVLFKLP